jgi:hypothetical protein
VSASTDLKERVLAAARNEPAPTRQEVRRRNGLLLVTSLVTLVGGFFAVGGLRVQGRSGALICGTCIGAALLAALASWVSLRRGRSMLGRPRAWLIAVSLGLPPLLLGWKLWWSGHFEHALVVVPTRPGLKCFGLSLGLSLWPLVAFVWARRHSDPTHPRALGAAAGTAIGACTWVLVDGWCPVAYPPHVIFGHFLPLCLLGLAGFFLGDLVTTVRRRRRNSA